MRAVVIEKTVHVDERGKGECPFCGPMITERLARIDRTLHVGRDVSGEEFWHCFRCGRGGQTDERKSDGR